MLNKHININITCKALQIKQEVLNHWLNKLGSEGMKELIYISTFVFD